MRRFFAAFLALAVAATTGAAAAPARVSFVRDAEIEETLRTYAQPLLEMAGLAPDLVTITLVEDPSLNAFVAGGPNLYFNTGLLQRTAHAGELLGVLAHEIGHVAGGHIVRGGEAQENASAQVILSTLLGIATAVATKDASAGAAVSAGGQAMARNSLLGFSRGQEASADSAALRYLDGAGLSAAGMLSFLEKLQDQELLPASAQDAIVRTHPLTRDRIDQVRAHVVTSPATDKPLPAGWDERHRRMLAKLDGFLDPRTALRRYAETDTTVPARYARAIAYYRRADLDRALPLIDGLLAEEPKNAWFWELKGQMLFENGRIAEAVEPYRQAVAFAPESALLRIGLAQALLAVNEPSSDAAAIAELLAAVQTERRNPFAWRLLATAYGRQGDIGSTALALAEEALAQDKKSVARQQAERAKALLPAGSPGWIRAQDIGAAAERGR